jgi:hypothetical protein
MGTKKIIVKFTDGASTEFTVGDDWTDEKIKIAIAGSKSGKGKTIAAIDGKTVDGQAASVTPPEEVDAGKVGNAIGKGINSAGKWIGNTAVDVGSAIGRGTWGALKGIAGYDESVKAQDDAVLERIKNIKY